MVSVGVHTAPLEYCKLIYGASLWECNKSRFYLIRSSVQPKSAKEVCTCIFLPGPQSFSPRMTGSSLIVFLGGGTKSE